METKLEGALQKNICFCLIALAPEVVLDQRHHLKPPSLPCSSPKINENLLTYQLIFFMKSFVILSVIMDGEIVYSLLFVCHLICLVVQSGDYNTLSCMFPRFHFLCIHCVVEREVGGGAGRVDTTKSSD